MLLCGYRKLLNEFYTPENSFRYKTALRKHKTNTLLCLSFHYTYSKEFKALEKIRNDEEEGHSNEESPIPI